MVSRLEWDGSVLTTAAFVLSDCSLGSSPTFLMFSLKRISK